jgi:hypothetical protein
MKTTATYLFISFFCISSIYSQEKIQGKIMITGGITDYILPNDFENYCTKADLQKIGSVIVKDIIRSTTEKLKLSALNNIEFSSKDSSFNILPRPFKDFELHKFGMMGGVFPTEFYLFGSNGQRLNDFLNYMYPKGYPKILKTSKTDLSFIPSEFEHVLIIWPLWWYHVRTETSTINENYTYLLIVYGLYSTKSGDLLFADFHYEKDKGKELEYDKLIDKMGEKISYNVTKFLAK